jgi:hypothetical protein
MSMECSAEGESINAVRERGYGHSLIQGEVQEVMDMEIETQADIINQKKMKDEKHNSKSTKVLRASAGEGAPGLQNSSQQETQEEKEAKMEERIIRTINGGVQTDLMEHRKKMQEDLKTMLNPLIEMMNRQSLANLTQTAPTHNHMGATNQQPQQECQATTMSEEHATTQGMQTNTEAQMGDAEPSQSTGEEKRTGMEQQYQATTKVDNGEGTTTETKNSGVQEAISSIEKGSKRIKNRSVERRSKDAEEDTQPQGRRRSRSPILAAASRKPVTEEE